MPGPTYAHVNPIGGGLGRLPTMPPIGFSCTLKGSCRQQRGPAASTATTTNTTAPKTQTTSTPTPRFHRFRRGGLHCGHHTTSNRDITATKRGNSVIRTTTRRRHDDSQPLMLQNPHRRRCGGRRRDLPRCRWAVAGPGRASRRRAERSSRRGRLAGGPPPTGTHSGRGLRRPQHPWGRKQRLVSYNPTSRYAQESKRRPRPAGAGRGQRKCAE